MKPIQADLLSYRSNLNLTQEDGIQKIHCRIRKKSIVLQPEELVRQLFIEFLVQTCHYKLAWIQVEKSLKLMGLTKRYDILIYDKYAMPYILVETKAPHVRITQDVLDQASHYNLVLQAPYLVVSNGIETFVCAMNFKQKSYEFLDAIPIFN